MNGGDSVVINCNMDIGSYQGFNMRIQFDSWSKEFILSVKYESVAKVWMGQDKRVHVHCNVSNTGNVAGAEVVQCYYETLHASVVRRMGKQ